MWKRFRSICIIGAVVLWIPLRLLSQIQAPTVVFTIAYIFEAKSNGGQLEFPLLPGETAIATLDSLSETAQDYTEKLKSIYSFNHFSLLTTLGGGFSIGLTDRDGDSQQVQIYGDKKHLFYLSMTCGSGPEDGLLSMRIETQLDTTTQQHDKFPDSNRIYLFKTLCTVQHSRPLVIGRPISISGGKKRAIFLVLTTFFHKLDQKENYPRIVADYRRVIQLSVSRHDMGGRHLFKAVNHYFQTKLNRKDILDFDAIYPAPPPPPPPPPNREDFPVFVSFDTPPEPIGGYQAIQKHLIYPELARKAGIEGRVLVWVKIDEEGKVIQTRILKSLGPNCIDQAAMNAVSSIRWTPAMSQNKPVTVWVAVPVDFRLK